MEIQWNGARALRARWSALLVCVMLASGMIGAYARKKGSAMQGHNETAAVASQRPSGPGTRPGVIRLPSGISDAQIEEFYHLQEGSEFVPLCALDLIQTATGADALG